MKYFLIFFVFLLFSCDQVDRTAKKIEKCADSKAESLFKKKIFEYELNNTYFSIKKKKSGFLLREKVIAQIIHKELSYLNEIKDQFYNIKSENIDIINKLNYNLKYMRTRWWSYDEAVEWAKDTESERFSKRIKSDFFEDYDKTKKRLENLLSFHRSMILMYETELSNLNEAGFNKNLAEKLDTKSKENKKFLKNKIDIKLQKRFYEQYFQTCEKQREESPILFDKKWK